MILVKSPADKSYFFQTILKYAASAENTHPRLAGYHNFLNRVVINGYNKPIG